ncbi:MAG TPA: sn-glycerol-3-phosphate ABC transporter ATP-binding protein UgpC [Chthoniobacterales bacterium]
MELIQIEKHYDSFHALKNIDLQVEKEEFVVFVGPSGCGKSTLLRSICGLETVTSGKIVLDGRDITSVHPSKRNVAMVFQNYALFPHLNVFHNIAFGLELQGLSKEDIQKRVERVATLLHLETMLDRKPKQLSGGQRQRVAIGRCIVKQPKLFLFDEPLSNLDAKLRVRMRVELLNLHYETRNTVVYVTHDQVEAMTMADKIVVLQDGRIEQVGSPMDLYEHPVNKFVAGFIGSPQMNFLEGRATRANGSGISFAADGLGTLELPLVAESVKADQAITVGVRPEDVQLDGGPANREVKAVVNIVENLGGETYLHVEVAPEMPLVMVKLHGSRGPTRGNRVMLHLPADKIYLFDATGGAIPTKVLN